MANNGKPGKGRQGALKGRSQFRRTLTGLWHKRHTGSGRIMDVKTSGGRFKGVRRER